VKEASLATYMSSFVKEEPQEPKQQQPLLNTTTSSAPLVIQGHQHHNQQQQYHRQHQYHTENDKVYFPTSPSTYHPGHQQQQQQQHAHTQEQQQQQQQTPLSQYLHPLQPTHYPLKQQQQQQREEEEEQQIPIENNIERKHRNHNQQEQESYYSNELEPKNIRLTIKTHNESDNGMSAESAAIVFPTAIATTHSRNDGDDDDDYVPNTPTSATVPTTPNVQRICVICNTPNTSKRQKWYTTSSFIDDYKKCFQIDQVTPGDVCEPCYQKCYRFRKQNSSGVITSKKKGLSKSAASQNGHKKDGPSFGKRRRKESKNSPDALYELVDETTDYNDEEFVVAFFLLSHEFFYNRSCRPTALLTDQHHPPHPPPPKKKTTHPPPPPNQPPPPHNKTTKEKVKFCIIEYIFIISDMKLSKVLALVVFGLLMVVQCAWALPAPTYATSALVRNAGRTSVPVVLTFGAEVSCLGSNSTVDVSSIGCSHNSMKMSATVPPKVSSTMGPVSIESGSTSQVWPIAYIVVGSTRVPIGELSRFFSGVVSPLGIGIGAPVSGQRVIKTVSGIYFSVPT